MTTEVPIQVWYASANNTLTKRYRDPIILGDPGGNPPTDRDSLVYGAYKPDATTTGVITGTVLTDWNASTVNTLSISAAQTFVNKKIYGDITINTGELVTFSNCELVGGNYNPTGDIGIINCPATRANTGRNVIIKDCTIHPRLPANGRDGIRGVRYEAYRNNIYNTNDGIGAFILTSQGTSVDIRVMGNFIHDLTYWYPDLITTSHTDGTHNDCVQIQGGADIWLKGNYFEGSSVKGAGSGDNPDKPWLLNTSGFKHTNGAGTIVQKQSSTADLINVVIEQNWYHGGLSMLNMKPGSYTFQNNIINRETAIGPSWSGYWLRGDLKSATFVTGLDTTNHWEDTGAILTEPRTSGIHWNA